MRRLLACAVVLAVVVSALPAGAYEGVVSSKNVRLSGEAKADRWVHRATFRKDLLFTAFDGEYGGGFHIYRLGREGESPLKRLSTFPCVGNDEGTIAHWKNFVFQALESPPGVKGVAEGRYKSRCGSEPGGIRVVDVSDPRNPRKAGFIALQCGSHGITMYPYKGGLLIYNSNGCSGQGALTGSTGQGGILNAPGRIDVIEFNEEKPSRSVARSHPVIGDVLDGGAAMNGCHDITIYPPRDLAVCTGTERWALLDISDPFNPLVLTIQNDGNLGAGSAQFTWDGNHIVLNEIPFRGAAYGEGCFGPQRDLNHGVRIWNVEDESNPVEVGYYRLDRDPPMWEADENDFRCHASNFTVIPAKKPGRYLAATSWGSGGLSVIDFSDPSNIKEIAYWQPQYATIIWWTAWYNGRVYIGENSANEQDGVPVHPPSHVPPKQWPFPGGVDAPSTVRALEVDGLRREDTYFFREGLVTQWQDPSNLKR